MAAWIGMEFGGECKHVYVWLSSFAFHLEIITNVVNWPNPQINKKLVKKITWDQMRGVQAWIHHNLISKHNLEPLLKPLLKSFQVGRHHFEGMNLLCPPLPGKEMNFLLFCFTQHSVSKSNLATAHRAWAFGIIQSFESFIWSGGDMKYK